MEKEKLKVIKVSFSKIPKNETEKLLFDCLDLILARQRKNNSNLLNKNPNGNNLKKSS
jgi:hypothetical protein